MLRGERGATCALENRESCAPPAGQQQELELWGEMPSCQGRWQGPGEAVRRLATYVSRWPLLAGVMEALAAGSHITWAVSGLLTMAFWDPWHHRALTTVLGIVSRPLADGCDGGPGLPPPRGALCLVCAWLVRG